MTKTSPEKKVRENRARVVDRGTSALYQFLNQIARNFLLSGVNIIPYLLRCLRDLSTQIQVLGNTCSLPSTSLLEKKWLYFLIQSWDFRQ